MKTSRIRLFAAPLLLALLLTACNTAKIAYPPAKMGSTVDTYHGAEVPDPYRWLEEPDSPDTQTWVAEQNKLTNAFLAKVPAREKIKTRLRRLMNHPRYSTPSKRGDRIFYWKNDGLQNQSVFYVQDPCEHHPQVVINPNLLTEDGTAAVSTAAVSWDGSLLAYGISKSGSDEKEIKIRTVGQDSDYDETLKWCRFTTIAWKHDATGFFYNRFPDPATVAPEDVTNYNRVYWHKLNTPQSADKLIYERPDNKELGFAPAVTDDGKFLILDVYHGTDTKNRIYYRPIDSSEAFTKLLDKADAQYDFVGNAGSIFYFKTDLDAPRGRIIAIDIENPAPAEWKTVIPQTADVIDFAAIINNRFIIVYMHDVHHQLKQYDTEGAFIRDFYLPGLGTVSGLSGKQNDTEMFFSFTSFLFPRTSYRHDFKKQELTIFRKPMIDFRTKRYEMKQVFCKSKDGTKIPIFITHRKGLTLTGDNPTLLYGYGGFNIDIKPSFSTSVANWLELGGVYAVANMRGGGEYGDEWHKAGMLENKQNVFDDFIAAAEWLIDKKYTNPQKLAIKGGSNGGLLVAACMLQRPDLYGAVVCQVPVADMLRYHKFTVGRYWIPEYGNPDTDPDMFKVLYAYSPLHNVEQGASYPPILVTSADTDDRVVPMHSKKFVATLQEKAASKNQILLRVDTKAGHGAGKPTTKRIEEQADIYAFLFKILKMKRED